MPFESSLILVVAFFIWPRVQARGLLVGIALLVVLGIGAFVADTLIVTDREYVLALLPRLAHAAESQDVATIMAALDPDLRPLHDEAKRVLKRVRPTEVTITSVEVAIDPATTPPRATANLVVRVTGNVIDERTPGTVLVGVKVLLHNRNGQWLVKEAEGRSLNSGSRTPRSRRE